MSLIRSNFMMLILAGVLLLTERAAAQSQPDAGAKKRHWAYVSPVPAELPRVQRTSWPRNGIDYFVLARLEQEHLQPSPEAERAVLLRRVSLDLIGLPPTVAELDEFLADRTEKAYEKAVDRLLASPHYGERWARPWLDLARYADTQGYEKDNRRSPWPWRDWVISALNRNLPFDQFTVEQIAGDLLPNATRDQKVATGFHRNTMTNTEGGTDDEEYRHEAVVDRVNTTMSAWMGTTMACAQCHNHKYDPFSLTEYYQLYAFFNQTADSDQDDERPTLKLPSPEQETQLRQLRTASTTLEAKLSTQTPELDAALARWEKALKPGVTNHPAGISNILAVAAEKRSAPQKAELAKHYRSIAPELQPAREELVRLQKQTAALENSIPTTAVLEEVASPRETRMHLRGAYLSLGEKVGPGVPAVWPGLPPNQPTNRLGFARWLVDTNNPLTARVAMNRVWQQYFGLGLVETLEDFGAQGEPPSHPRLLDWLATEFMARNWDLKAMHRLIVNSATYRQSSRVTPEAAQRDPYNRLLARGPRARLEAELVRDQALAVSGLLSHKIGGPPVMPSQPAGIWQVVYSGDAWGTSPGEDRYRRGLYTFWRRTSPYPSMVTFDAPSREYCVVRRNRSNTPLQALTLLNDPVYMEAAVALAGRMTKEAGPNPTERAAYGFRLAVARVPQASEVARLVALYEKELARFKADPKAAAALIANGPAKVSEVTDLTQLAAWTVVANVLLNLDEVVTKG